MSGIRPGTASPGGRRDRRLLAALGLVALGLLLAPLPVAAADPTASPAPMATAAPSTTPSPSPAPTRAPVATLAPVSTAQPGVSLTSVTYRRAAPAATLAPVARPTDVLIYRGTAMVKQFTNYWCVPAATQSMVNLVLGTSDRTKTTQERYYKGIRAHNRYTYSTKGNDPQGWAWGLRSYSSGRTTYQARSFTSKSVALEAIAESIDRTGSPVGVTVHDGTHAWIVLGYRAQPDPNASSGRLLTGFYVSGPLGSPTDPWPYKFMTMTDFRSHFSRYHEWQRAVIWEGTWVIVSQ
jgi:hypothetical protein